MTVLIKILIGSFGKVSVNYSSLLLLSMSGIFIWIFCLPCFAQQTRPLPVYPQATQAGPDTSEKARAEKLYQLARIENRQLQWNGCLATQAFMRAKRMSAQHYFEHEDPKTGKNPVWNTVRLCVPAERARSKVPAGENLTKGIDTPEKIHRALMESPTHRKNIQDRRFNRMGVGCHADICVELFAGF